MRGGSPRETCGMCGTYCQKSINKPASLLETMQFLIFDVEIDEGSVDFEAQLSKTSLTPLAEGHSSG